MNNIIPFGSNILIKPTEKKKLLVSDRKSLQEYGTVIAVGKDAEPYIKVGQTVFYTVWGTKSVEYEGEDYYFIPCDSRFLLGTL